MSSASSHRAVRVVLPALTGLLLLAGCSADADDAGEAAAPAAAAGGVPGAASIPLSTPQEGAETDPDQPVATDPPRPPAAAGTGTAVIGYLYWDAAAGAVVAGGYVSPVIEDGGTCTLVLTRPGTSVSTDSAAAADATTTACAELSLPVSELSAGEWQAELRYESDTTEAVSDPLPVEVPA